MITTVSSICRASASSWTDEMRCAFMLNSERGANCDIVANSPGQHEAPCDRTDQDERAQRLVGVAAEGHVRKDIGPRRSDRRTTAPTDWEGAVSIVEERRANSRAALPTARGSAHLRIRPEERRRRPKTLLRATQTTTRSTGPATKSDLSTDDDPGDSTERRTRNEERPEHEHRPGRRHGARVLH
ncbi:hypothetical protein PF003_g36551 [Phytophthora fragariae]|nr:hypothetical protein PF003_g36551 [Phytophthora fragariae]